MQFSFIPNTDALVKVEEMATLLGEEEEDGEGVDEGAQQQQPQQDNFIGRVKRSDDGDAPERAAIGIQIPFVSMASGEAPKGGNRHHQMANGHRHVHVSHPAPMCVEPGD